MNTLSFPIVTEAADVSSACLVSVLMSTYAAETADHLATSLESLFSQTVLPDQLVLVIDGPIGIDQEAVIECYRHDARIPEVKVVRLPKNQGLANALNAGLEACRGEWIMRMDSDDISVPERLALQLDYVERYPHVDVFSSWCEEFFEDGRRQIKASSIQHEEVINSLRWRNVIVHPTVLIRTGMLRQIGGYRSQFGKLEDYDLYVRLALAGAKFRVIPAELVKFRMSGALHTRRGGFRYLLGELRFRVFCLRSGFVSLGQFLLITGAYTAFRMVGAGMRGWLYRFARA